MQGQSKTARARSPCPSLRHELDEYCCRSFVVSSLAKKHSGTRRVRLTFSQLLPMPPLLSSLPGSASQSRFARAVDLFQLRILDNPIRQKPRQRSPSDRKLMSYIYHEHTAGFNAVQRWFALALQSSFIIRMRVPSCNNR